MDAVAFGWRFLPQSAQRTFTAALLPMPGAQEKMPPVEKSSGGILLCLPCNPAMGAVFLEKSLTIFTLTKLHCLHAAPAGQAVVIHL